MKVFGFTIGREEPKISNYLFLQKEIIKALDIVFTGFNTGEYYFVPPDSVIEGYYQYLHDEYERLNDDKEVDKWLKRKNIPLTSLHSFRSLILDFDVRVEFWNSLKTVLLHEKEFLDKFIPHGGYVDEKIKLKAYEMEKWLEEHRKLKDAILLKQTNPVFTWKQFSLDTKNGILIVHDKKFTINPNTKEFLFLAYLIQNAGLLVHYKDLGAILRINAYREDIAQDKDIARAIQDIKKSLKNSLTSIKVSKEDIRYLLDSIQSVTNTGYRLIATS